MKTKILSLVLAIVLAMGVFSGVCFMTANAQELPNLLKLYGYQPDFEEGSGPWETDNANFERTNDLSHDGDGYVFTVANRASANDGP